MTFKDNSIKIDCILPIYIFIDLNFFKSTNPNTCKVNISSKKN